VLFVCRKLGLATPEKIGTWDTPEKIGTWDTPIKKLGLGTPQ